MKRQILIVTALALMAHAGSLSAQTVVNDVTQLNPIPVARVVAPDTIAALSDLVHDQKGPISIGGGRFSQGGQIATDNALFIDMRRLNHITAIDPAKRTITVEAGATWRQVQEAVDPYDLAPMIMQSYANFTVGGSLSVNCHGRYANRGPIVESVISIRLIMADGRIVTASRDENADLFFGAIGGYGGIGVIAEATLKLDINQRIERRSHAMMLRGYRRFYEQYVAGSTTTILHNATLYPPDYDHLDVHTSTVTDRALTIKDRLPDTKPPSTIHRSLMTWLTFGVGGKWVRRHIYDPAVTDRAAVVWRNYEAANDVNQLEPASRAKSTYVLQEYFIPEARLEAFVPKMAAILRDNHANVINVSIRHAKADPDTLLNWAPTPVFAFVIYFEQGTKPADRAVVANWTRDLIDAALTEGGTYYLPYQIVATREQFLKAYPRAEAFFAVKRRVDPTYKFRNRLWDAYYFP